MDYSNMYKSRAGNHSNLAAAGTRGGRHTEQIKRKRINDRQKAHEAHRRIEPTPRKRPEPTQGVHNDKQPKTILPTTVQAPTVVSKNDQKLSRQELFRLKFQKYRDEKAKQQNTKKTVLPFVSSVPSGRIVNSNKEPIANKLANKPKPLVQAVQRIQRTQISRPPKRVQRPGHSQPTRSSQAVLSNQLVQLVPSIEPSKPIEPAKKDEPVKIEEETIVFSPINTRSRNLQLMSPSNLPTPRRRSYKKSLNEYQNNITVIIGAKQSSTSSDAAESISLSKNNRPQSSLNVSKIPPIPAEFQFVQTSTVAKKPRVETTISEESSEPSASSRMLFDETISPIENTATPKLSIVSQSVKKLKSEQPCTPDARKLSAKEKVDVLKTPTQQVQPDSANYVSPFVTISRGSRANKSKEEEARNIKYTLNSRSLLNDSVEERQNKEAALYFRTMVAKETERLMKIVNEWENYKAKNVDAIPTEYIDSIDSAIGQTRLLTANKFKQFSGLIDKCESLAYEQQSVRPVDLEGFWSMVFMQVENCNARFERLNLLRLNNWEAPELQDAKKKKSKLNGIKNAKVFKAKPNRGLQEMMRAARKAFKENAPGEIATNNRRRSLALTVAADDSLCQLNKSKRKSIWVVSYSKSNPINYLINKISQFSRRKMEIFEHRQKVS